MKMKMKLGIVGMLLLGILAYAQNADVFSQDFEDVEPGAYHDLFYNLNGVDVWMHAPVGEFNIIDSGHADLMGERSMSVKGGAEARWVSMYFTPPVQGIMVDMVADRADCNKEPVLTSNGMKLITSRPYVKCYALENGRWKLVFKLGVDRDLPCSSPIRSGVAMLDEPIIKMCYATEGIFDNLAVEP